MSVVTGAPGDDQPLAAALAGFVAHLHHLRVLSLDAAAADTLLGATGHAWPPQLRALTVRLPAAGAGAWDWSGLLAARLPLERIEVHWPVHATAATTSADDLATRLEVLPATAHGPPPLTVRLHLPVPLPPAPRRAGDPRRHLPGAADAVELVVAPTPLTDPAVARGVCAWLDWLAAEPAPAPGVRLQLRGGPPDDQALAGLLGRIRLLGRTVADRLVGLDVAGRPTAAAAFDRC